MGNHKDQKEHIEDLMYEVENLKKEIQTRDVIISNMVHEIDSTKKIRSQIRKIFRTINTNIMDKFNTMRKREIIDHSSDALLRLRDINEGDNPKIQIKKINDHDTIICTEELESHSIKSVSGEVFYHSYNILRRTTKFIVFGLLNLLRGIKRSLK